MATEIFLVTVRDTVLSTYRVEACSSDEALDRWWDGDVIENAYERIEATALAACRETPALDLIEALQLCIERLTLNNCEGSEAEAIATATQAIAFAKGARQ